MTPAPVIPHSRPLVPFVLHSGDPSANAGAADRRQIAVAVLAGPIYELSERTARDLLDPEAYVQAVVGR